MGLRPTQGDEKRLGPASALYRTVTLSCHPDRSGGTCGSADPSWRCIFDRVVMGLRPIHGDKKRVGPACALSIEPLPFPCHPDRSGGTCGSADPSWRCIFDRVVMGLRPTQGDEKRVGPASTLSIEPLPFPCHPDRSGGTCGSADPSWRCIFDRVVMGLRPTQGDEKRLGPASALYRTVTLSLSSRPERRDLQFRGPFLAMYFRQSCHGPAAHPRR
jgi:hypothetical protein